MADPFDIPVTSYVPDRDFKNAYIRQNSLYLNLMTGKPMDVTTEFVTRKIATDPKFKLNNPKIIMNVKNKHGDRKTIKATLGQFLTKVDEMNLRLSPSLTAYLGEEKRVSEHAMFIEGEMRERKKNKSLQFKYDEEKNFYLRDLYEIKQVQNKTYTNAYSGATVSKATILYNKSTHSSLTTLCRSATSYANASNEKVIGGNRHYYNPSVIRSNLLSIIDLTDLEALDNTIKGYGLVYPSVDDVMEMITYSSINYGRFEAELRGIRMMVSGMSDVQRAACVYIGDMYHTYKHNPRVITELLRAISYTSKTSDGPNVRDVYDSLDDKGQIMIKMLHFRDVKGRPFSQIEEEEPEVFGKLNATARNLISALDYYSNLITNIFLTDNLPSSVFEFPSCRRRVVPISDTDSTIFTCEYWCNEVYGEDGDPDDHTSITLAVVYLITGITEHILGLLAAFMGVAHSKLRLLNMKNEFYFKSLAATTSAKHYFASQNAREGNFFPKYRKEIKGVGLKDSKLPGHVTAKAEELIGYILETLNANKKIDLFYVMGEMANVEREIRQSIEAKETKYLTAAKVKPAESYSKEEDAETYLQYTLWQSVFAPKYGNSPPPEYQGVKLKVMLDKPSKVKDWISSSSNPEMANAFATWLSKHGKKGMTNLIMPSVLVETGGIPDEIMEVCDIRANVLLNTGPFYIIAGALGVQLTDDNYTNLISDYF